MSLRGEVWMVSLDPIRGSEQAGTRPALILQNDSINRFTTTVIAIPLTTNLSRAALPSALFLPHGEGGLPADSVLLCHQTPSLDKVRLIRRLGKVSNETLAEVENRILFTLQESSYSAPLAASKNKPLIKALFPAVRVKRKVTLPFTSHETYLPLVNALAVMVFKTAPVAPSRTSMV
jgi:mRNA interferase MazF